MFSKKTINENIVKVIDKKKIYNTMPNISKALKYSIYVRNETPNYTLPTNVK